MNKIKNLAIYTFLIALPSMASAQSNAVICKAKYAKSIQGYVCEIIKLTVDFLIPALNLAAFGFFVFNIVRYIYKSDNEKARTQYRQSVIWSIFALFVMLSIWGIVNILGEIVGINTSIVPNISY